MNEETAAQAERVWFRLLRLQTRLSLAMGDRLRAIGLSVPQCDVLTTLTEREGVTQSELAVRLYVTKGNISGLIDRMAAAGLVERRASAGDRRSHAIYLTEQGRGLAMAALEAQRTFIRDTLGRLPPDRLAEFEALLIAARDRIRAAGAAQRRRAPPGPSGGAGS